VDRNRLADLRRMLTERFSERELRDLCFDLGVDYEILPGQDKADKARELIVHLERRDCIPQLVRIARQQRPDIPWNDSVGLGEELHFAGGGTRTPPPIPHLLPPRAQHFIGRQGQLSQLLAALHPGQVVTLCGPGGIGKTALAAEALWTLDDRGELTDRFPDGIVFHSFYNQPEAAIALETIARAYGQDPRPTPREAALRALAGRKALLFLDGTEAADDLQAVLDVRGGCAVIVTTRRHQDAPATWCDLAPLPLEEAASLLRAWGGGRAADRAAVESVCRLVGRLPLAVRLAGRYLTETGEQVAEYLAWLEAQPLAALHRGKRQRESVTVLLDRSVAQVSHGARQVLAVVGLLALSAFAPGPVAAALEVAERRTCSLLGELVNYGLLLRDDGRYQVSHRLIHTYARQSCPPSGDLLARLAAHYDTYVREQRELGLEGYAALDAERSHVMAVLGACEICQEWTGARDLAWAVDSYLNIQGHWTERVTAIQAGLAAARALDHHRDEGAFLGNLGLAYRDLGQVERAIDYYQQALAIAQEIGDRRGEGNRLGNLGNAYRALGQVERAIEYHEKALAIDQEIGDRRSEGICCWNLGLLYEDTDPARAADLMQICVDYEHEIGHPDAEPDAQRVRAIRARLPQDGSS
jgi:tetratricopeptide (TPR) repeat protein